MVRHVPNADLAGDTVSANDLEQLPAGLIAIATVEVDQRLRTAHRNDFIFLIKGDTQDVAWPCYGHVYFLDHSSRLDGRIR